MVGITSLVSLILPLTASIASASHLPPPHKRAGHHDKARKNFEHIHSSDNAPAVANTNNQTIVPRGTSYTGTGTFYYTGLGACGQYSKDSDFMVALNSAQYGGGYPGPQCFKGITIQANGKTVGGVTIMDECPTCGYGSLDLSPGLFTQFASEDAGVISITWWFNDDAPAESTSETPTSTWVAPTSTYTPPTSTWVEPTSTYTPPTSTYTPPASSSTTQWSQAPTSTSTSQAPSSSTITSSAASGSASASASGSIIAHNTTNPYVVVSSNSTAATTAKVSADGSEDTSADSSSSVSVLAGVGNIEGLNGLVAQYGQLVVVAAEAA
ncbi:uncharacterized protein I303_103020 [Kwoniella dejecticola CBS 10117]|uniref:B2-aldehyde-forming enzyme n=1 Tax=Kwoniella dejecticola CBS 10117 TaxID=1296121 RepID=A0A1A6AAD3_9TREE|nr:uncharacterized protein I303_03040 [Kwoniella dejecticola CBS 10117]OBR87018.1 hypothetical protein I303_03040 [Kwoniella dejecticola CBS 10117]